MIPKPIKHKNTPAATKRALRRRWARNVSASAFDRCTPGIAVGVDFGADTQVVCEFVQVAELGDDLAYGLVIARSRIAELRVAVFAHLQEFGASPPDLA